MEKFDFSVWGFGAEMAHGAETAMSDTLTSLSTINPLGLADVD